MPYNKAVFGTCGDGFASTAQVRSPLSSFILIGFVGAFCSRQQQQQQQQQTQLYVLPMKEPDEVFNWRFNSNLN